MSRRGWDSDLRALAQQVGPRLPPLRPRFIGIGLAAVLLLILALSADRTTRGPPR